MRPGPYEMLNELGEGYGRSGEEVNERGRVS